MMNKILMLNVAVVCAFSSFANAFDLSMEPMFLGFANQQLHSKLDDLELTQEEYNKAYALYESQRTSNEFLSLAQACRTDLLPMVMQLIQIASQDALKEIKNNKEYRVLFAKNIRLMLNATLRLLDDYEINANDSNVDVASFDRVNAANIILHALRAVELFGHDIFVLFVERQDSDAVQMILSQL